MLAITKKEWPSHSYPEGIQTGKPVNLITKVAQGLTMEWSLMIFPQNYLCCITVHAGLKFIHLLNLFHYCIFNINYRYR